MAEHVTDATFEKLVTESDMPVLVDFWAPWCSPCRALGPIIDDISKEYTDRVRVYKLNVDENPATPAKFAIRAIPTLILFKNGETLEQITGGVSKVAIIDLLDKKALA
jgi:thioredoxin 1